jgi:hypothetical protein
MIRGELPVTRARFEQTSFNSDAARSPANCRQFAEIPKIAFAIL